MTKKIRTPLFKKDMQIIKILLNFPEEKLQMTINEILDNAYHLIKDAELLIETHGSFGHGFGLIALACKEIAKVICVCLEKQKDVYQEDRSREFNKDPLLNHLDKQECLAVLTFGGYILRYFSEYAEDTIGEFDDENAFNRCLQNFIKKLETDELLRSRLEHRIYFFGRLEDDNEGEAVHKTGHLSELREYSLYVDVIDNSKIITPKYITRDCVMALKSICEEDLYYTDEMYNNSQIAMKYGIKKPPLPLTK